MSDYDDQAMRDAVADGVYPPQGGKWRGAGRGGPRCPDCGALLGYDPAYTPPDHPRVLAHAPRCPASGGGGAGSGGPAPSPGRSCLTREGYSDEAVEAALERRAEDRHADDDADRYADLTSDDYPHD